MRKVGSKILSWLLTVVIVLGLMPVNAYAEESHPGHEVCVNAEEHGGDRMGQKPAFPAEGERMEHIAQTGSEQVAEQKQRTQTCIDKIHNAHHGKERFGVVHQVGRVTVTGPYQQNREEHKGGVQSPQGGKPGNVLP